MPNGSAVKGLGQLPEECQRSVSETPSTSTEAEPRACVCHGRSGLAPPLTQGGGTRGRRLALSATTCLPSAHVWCSWRPAWPSSSAVPKDPGIGISTILDDASPPPSVDESEPDKYFWLRETPDGSEVDGLRRRVAAVFDGLPFRAQMLLDSAVAGEPRGAPSQCLIMEMPSTGSSTRWRCWGRRTAFWVSRSLMAWSAPGIRRSPSTRRSSRRSTPRGPV